LPIRALLESARTDEAVLAALSAKRPELFAARDARARAEGHEEGRADGLRHAVRALAQTLAIEVPIDDRGWLDGADAASLERLLDTLQREHRWSRR
jgi:hypothetical protein